MVGDKSWQHGMAVLASPLRRQQSDTSITLMLLRLESGKENFGIREQKQVLLIASFGNQRTEILIVLIDSPF